MGARQPLYVSHEYDQTALRVGHIISSNCHLSFAAICLVLACFLIINRSMVAASTGVRSSYSSSSSFAGISSAIDTETRRETKSSSLYRTYKESYLFNSNKSQVVSYQSRGIRGVPVEHVVAEALAEASSESGRRERTVRRYIARYGRHRHSCRWWYWCIDV